MYALCVCARIDNWRYLSIYQRIKRDVHDVFMIELENNIIIRQYNNDRIIIMTEQLDWYIMHNTIILDIER